MCKKIILISFLMVCLMGTAVARTASTDNASVYIISPSHGEMVTNPVTVRFGLKGMGVAPAGTDKAKTGHHHLMIDANLKSMDESIPKDKEHMHFGGGQTETSLKLSPGRHTLQLMMGDMKHIPHNPPVMSQQITIFVK
jgi:hypothetical protein